MTWCENLIADVEANPDDFKARHKRDLVSGVLRLRPSEKDSGAMGEFTIDERGDYECRYWQGGLAGPHGNKYDSRTKRWTRF
jgi:hypothetical protein